jgi:hypothetical protein
MMPPDQPAWVQARAMLEGGGAWTSPGLVGDDRAQLAVALPGAAPAAVADAMEERAGWTLLVPEGGARGQALADELAARGFDVVPASVYTLTDPAHLPEDAGAGLLPEGEARAAALAGVPPALADELGRSAGPVVAIAVDGRPAAFAHAPWRTAAWFELAADTLPELRQRGLATRAAAHLCRLELAAGRSPVMGALDASAAAHRLATRLGMTVDATMFVAWPPG